MTFDDTERAARAMFKRERIEYLQARGWTRIDAEGSRTWEDTQGAGRCTLALALRIALEDENPPTDRPTKRAQVELEHAAAQAPVGTHTFACVGCHATEQRLAQHGHIGGCAQELRHLHRTGVPIEHCESWFIYGRRSLTRA